MSLRTSAAPSLVQKLFRSSICTFTCRTEATAGRPLAPDGRQGPRCLGIPIEKGSGGFAMELQLRSLQQQQLDFESRPMQSRHERIFPCPCVGPRGNIPCDWRPCEIGRGATFRRFFPMSYCKYVRLVSGWNQQV